MSEDLSPTDWTELVQEPAKNWEEERERRKKTPVVKLTFRDGGTVFGALGIREDVRGRPHISDITLERGGDRFLTYLTGPIPFDDLKAGKIRHFGAEIEVEFVGLASDTRHEGRTWNY
jgi:hypothetical protein